MRRRPANVHTRGHWGFSVWTVLLVLALGGCGHVAGNYPEPSSPEPPSLPEHFRLGKIKGKLVWNEPGVVHGFRILWEAAEVSTARLQGWATQGNRQAALDVERFEPMAEANYACAAVWVFVAPGFHRSIQAQEMRLEFGDGSSAVAEELFLYNPPGTNAPIQSTVNGTITLDAKADPEESGRYLYVFTEAEYLEREIVAITCTAR